MGLERLPPNGSSGDLILPIPNYGSDPVLEVNNTRITLNDHSLFDFGYGEGSLEYAVGNGNYFLDSINWTLDGGVHGNGNYIVTNYAGVIEATGDGNYLFSYRCIFATGNGVNNIELTLKDFLQETIINNPSIAAHRPASCARGTVLPHRARCQ